MYRYYRFFMINNYGSSYFGVSEMEFLDKSNIDLTDTLSPTAFTASSSFNSGYSASKVFDNIWDTNNTAWLSASGQINQWIVVDFGKQVDIFKVKYQSDAFDNIRVCVKDFRIEGSNDKTNWEVLFNGTLKMSTDIQVINLKPYKAVIKNPTTNEHYSLSDNTLIPIPDPSTKNIALWGIEQGKEIQLDTQFNKIQHIEITPIRTTDKERVFRITTSNTKNFKEKGVYKSNAQ